MLSLRIPRDERTFLPVFATCALLVLRSLSVPTKFGYVRVTSYEWGGGGGG